MKKVPMLVAKVGMLALEVWNIYGNCYCFRLFVELTQSDAAPPWLTQLYLPYTLLFGMACLASVAAILLKQYVFLGLLARKLRQADAVLDHRQQLADSKKEMICMCCRRELTGPADGCAFGLPFVCVPGAIQLSMLQVCSAVSSTFLQM